MRIVLQRVSRASVTVAGEVVGSIADGLLLLVGIEPTDTPQDVDRAADKVSNLRIFADEGGLMNRSIIDIGGSALVVSQFTLISDMRRGRRPSFVGAADPGTAAPLVERLAEMLRDAGIHTETGVFGASMAVDLVNDGPVTVILEIREGRVS
ncbi:MAG TPA: D-aminoacyl-tRNA deacylase [Acidimicrobiia bacterium]|nr:D-aminoacyl-tRNA deacylase [Acidimicrobiia bacterium]